MYAIKNEIKGMYIYFLMLCLLNCCICGANICQKKNMYVAGSLQGLVGQTGFVFFSRSPGKIRRKNVNFNQLVNEIYEEPVATIREYALQYNNEANIMGRRAISFRASAVSKGRCYQVAQIHTTIRLKDIDTYTYSTYLYQLTLLPCTCHIYFSFFSRFSFI